MPLVWSKRSWTTREQFDFLSNQIDGFLTSQRVNGTSTPFLTNTYAKWFELWPELEIRFPGRTKASLSKEENAVFGHYIQTRQKVRH